MLRAVDNKHRKLIIALCNEELFRFIAGNWYLYIVTIRRFVNGIGKNWSDNVGRSAPLGNYDLAILLRQFERPFWVPPIFRFCYSLLWFHVAPPSVSSYYKVRSASCVTILIAKMRFMYILANKKWVHENRPVRLCTNTQLWFYGSPPLCSFKNYVWWYLKWQNDINVISKWYHWSGRPLWLAAIFIATEAVGKFAEFEDFLAVQMRSVCGCSWQFSKLWISRGFGTVTVLVGEVW